MSTSDTQDVSPDITPLDAVIRDYLLRIDRGEAVSHRELLASYPDLQVDLKAFFEGVAIVQRMAGAPSALTDTSQPTKFDTKYATVAKPESSSSELSKTSHSKSAADLTGPFPILLGQYRILKNIGQGAMGAVYVADDIRLGRKVALKVPLAEVAARPDHLDRFTREARASAQLRHHNICPVYEVNEQDGVQYIAMAYIEGQPLLEVLRKNRRYSGKQMAVTIRKIALALDVAHRAGIVHRDLKPANIMIDKEGEPIVMDFGLARQIHSIDQAQLTKDGVILGTPAYMSPEQVRSELKRIGPASDIYSLGVILYELLCGTHPFRGPLMTVLMNVADNNLQPRKPSEVRPNCDPQLEAICLRMISKRIADRYPSMKDVAAALSEYIKTGKTAPEISVTETPVKQADPEPVAVPAETPAPVPTVEPLKTESAGTKKPPRRRMGVMLGGLFTALLAGVIIITITTQDGKKTVVKVPEGTEIDVAATPGAKISIAVSNDPNPAADGKKPVLMKVPEDEKGAIPASAGAKVTSELAKVAGRPIGGKQPLGWHGWPADAPPPAIAPFNAEQAKKHQEAWATYLKVPVEYTNSIGMKFALIPPGEFMMGSSQEEIDSELKTLGTHVAEGWDIAVASEGPKCKVTITQPLYVGVHEVRRGDYEKVLKTSQSGNELKDHAVLQVSWFDAVDFCLGLCRLEQLPPSYFLDTHLQGSGYRLLTEAEWEHSCRAGTTTRYWSGDAVESFIRVGWCKENAEGKRHNVGELLSNPFGLHDMLGGVWELVIDGSPDWFVKDVPPSSELSKIDPMSPREDYPIRVVRGGDTMAIAAKCRSAIRTMVKGREALYAGFRVALTVDVVRQALKVEGPMPHAGTSSGLVSSTDYSGERKAAEHILASGGTIVLDSGETLFAYGSFPFVPSHVRQVRIGGAAFTDAELLQFEPLRGLQVLELNRTAITSAGLSRQLVSWPQLKSLNLNGMDIKDGKLDLSGAGSLREIVLPPTPNNEVLKHVAGACPLLKNISLARSSGVDLTSLGPLKYLAEISCNGHVLTEEGIKSLAAIPSLNKLVWHSPVSDEVARRVSTLGTQLQSLEIVYSDDNSTPLTDDGYRSLAKSLRLLEFTIRGKTGSPTPAALMTIAATMPDLRSLSIACDDADKALSSADIVAFRQRHPHLDLTVGQTVLQGYASWPEGRSGGIASWDLPQGAPDPAIAPFSVEKAQEYQTKWSDFLSQDVEFVNSIGMKFRLIPPGEFVRTEQGGAADRPSLKLQRAAKAYYLGSTEVTVGQFKRFVAATGYQTEAERLHIGRNRSGSPDEAATWKTPGYVIADDLPVNVVSLADADAFCEWLNTVDASAKSAGGKQEQPDSQKSDTSVARRRYRLPTETEWMAACSAGIEFMDTLNKTPEKLLDYAWVDSNVHGKPTPVQAVGTKLANPFGLHDVLGNIWEWYTDDNKIGIGVIGGGYLSGGVRVSYDARTVGTNYVQPNVGFRVLREIDVERVEIASLPLSTRLRVGYRKPLSAQAKVSQPSGIEGVRSWSVEPKRHRGDTGAFAHHPTEDQLITGGWDGSIRIWSEKGDLLKCLLGHSASITTVRFLDRGTKILSSDAFNEIRIWDSETGALLRSHRSGGILPVALSPDEKSIAAASPFETIVLLDVATGSVRTEYSVHGSYVVAWSPDSKYLATTSGEHAIYIWQVKPWKQIAKVPLSHQFLSYNQLTQNLTWSPDGKTIAFSPDNDASVILIDATTFSVLPGLEIVIANNWGGRSPVWSHDGRHLAVCHLYDSTVVEFATGKIRCKLPGAEALSWSRDDSKIYLNTGQCFDASTGKQLHHLEWHEKTSTSSASLSPDGRFISSSDTGGHTSIWTAATGQLQASWISEPNQSTPFWTPDGASMVVMKDGKLEFPDPATGMATRSFMAHTNGIQAAVFSPDGRCLATSGREDNRLSVFHSTNGQSKWTVDTRSRADCIAWSPDGKEIVTGHSVTGELRIWSLNDGKLIKSYGPKTSQRAVPFSRNFHEISYLDWSFQKHEILVGQPYIGFLVNLEPESIEHWGWHHLRGGHANQNRLAPNREYRLLHNEWGFTLFAGPDSSHALGQIGRSALWMPDSRRVLLEPEASVLCGYDLATHRRLGTLRQSNPANLWYCIGPTGHYRSGFVDQPGDGTDTKALSAVEDLLIYVVQTEDGSQVTYSPREFAEKFGWKNDPQKATLMKLNLE